jgi:uncharacterized membrane protein YfcA
MLVAWRLTLIAGEKRGEGHIALLGFMAGGMLLGMKLHSRMKPEQVRKVVHLLLIISGSSLVIRALLMTAS